MAGNSTPTSSVRHPRGSEEEGSLPPSPSPHSSALSFTSVGERRRRKAPSSTWSKNERSKKTKKRPASTMSKKQPQSTDTTPKTRSRPGHRNPKESPVNVRTASTPEPLASPPTPILEEPPTLTSGSVGPTQRQPGHSSQTAAPPSTLPSSSGGPRPALAQVKDLAQADVHTSWSLSQTTSLGLTSRHKKPRGGDVAQTNDPSAIDAEATAPPNQTTTSLTPSSRLRKSRDRKKTKPVEMTEAEPAPSAVSDPLVKQNLRDAVPPSRRPVVTPSTQPLPKSPTVQEQQRPETAVASNSRGQTAVTPAAAVPASQGDSKLPDLKRPDTVLPTKSGLAAAANNDVSPQPPMLQPQNAGAVTNDRFNDATPPAPGTLRASSLPPDAVVDPLPPEPTPAAPAVPAVFGEDASRIATPPARESTSEVHCSEPAPLLPKRVCSVRLEAAEWFRVYLAGFIIAEMVLIVLILVLPLGGRQDIDDIDDAGVCATPDCIRHAHVLGLLNRSEDGDSVPGPCDDFGKFVCSAARNRYGRLAADVVSQMILNWVASLMYEAPVLSPKLDNFSKPAAMIQACTLCKGCGEASTKALVEFVANRTFGWPTVGDDHEGNPSRRYDSAVTLQALVELSVEWALPLWFRLELSTPSHLHGRRVFYILPSPMPSLWDGFHRDLLSVGDTYATYLGLFNDTILSMRKPPQHYSTFLTERSKDFQLEIFETLRETTEAAEPLFVELGQLHPILRNVRAGDWYRILQSVYNVSPPVSQRDLVFLSNGRLLTAIGNLFSTRTPTDIFYHTTWWFLQAMGPFASDAVFSFLNANPTGKLFLQTMCGVQLESSYYDSLAAVNKAKIPGDQRLAISIYLRNVRTVAAERIRSFDSINNTAQDSLSNTLEKTVDFIWPEKDVEELERYHGWPNASLGDYFSQWISRSPHVHDSSNGSAPLDSRSKVYRLDGRHVTSYDPLSNVISVSVAALYSPLFYFNGTSAMTYGGLGFIYATEVLRALDTATLLGVGDGVLTPTNTTSLTGLQNAFACVNPVLAFPESPALRVAYEAYLRFRNVTTDLPLKGLANYSAEQIFFVTFCHTTCEFPESGYPESPRCTEAVMNFEPFLKAFNCRPDAKMNNATNCSINF